MSSIGKDENIGNSHNVWNSCDWILQKYRIEILEKKFNGMEIDKLI